MEKQPSKRLLLDPLDKVAPLTGTAKRLASILDSKTNKVKRRKVSPTARPAADVTNMNIKNNNKHTPASQQIVPPIALRGNNSKTATTALNLEPSRTLQQTRGWKPATKSTQNKPKSLSSSSSSSLSSSSTLVTPATNHKTVRKRPSLEGNHDHHHLLVSRTNTLQTPRINKNVNVASVVSSQKMSPQGMMTTTNLPNKTSTRVRWMSAIERDDSVQTEKIKATISTSTASSTITPQTISNTPKPRLSLQTSSRATNRPRERLAMVVTAQQDTIVPPPPQRNVTNDEESFVTIATTEKSPMFNLTQSKVPIPPNSRGPTIPTQKLPSAPSITSFSQHGSSSSTAASAPKSLSLRPNLVRQNLRNANGSCRNKRASHKKQRQNNNFSRHRTESKSTSIERPQGLDNQTGTDPVDDFVDGIDPAKTAANVNSKGIPLCQGHQQPCCLRTVRKSGSAHKGRKFYVCAMDRREQCNHFQWADEGTAHAVVTKEDSATAFVQRQVQAYLQNLQPLALPELRIWASTRHLDTRGKRGQLWTRIALYVRDEIASALDEGTNATNNNDQDSDVELELVDPSPATKKDKRKMCHLADSLDGDESEFTGGIACTKSVAKDDKKANESDQDDDDDSDEELIFTESSSKDTNVIREKDDDDGNDCNCDDEEEPVVAQLKKGSFDEDEESTDESDAEVDSGTKRSMETRARTSVGKDEVIMNVDEDESDEELEIVPPKVQRKPKPDHNTVCPLLRRLQALFGHSDFRPGQEWTIRRCLEGQRTLLVAPTGLGKSLCYALPAAMQPNGVVLVVSPLLSLIQDQLRELPPSLPAASLSGTTPSPTLLQDLRRGRLRILFVSPERLVSPSFRRLLSKTSWNDTTRSYERIMPPVSLFCVDEAHCLSQWGHNFRPCYLRLQSVLNLIQPKSVLAITATAGPLVIDDITRTLGMPKLKRGVGDDTQGIKIYKADRDNINVTAHFVDDHADRLNRLVAILSPKQASKEDEREGHGGCLARGSVIVYVWRQMDAEVIAEYIAAANVPGKVVVYHGGMDSGSRAKAQSQFLRGKARICVATVAFGLGINKSDVAGVIHMYLSNTPEHYLQEIGRAGRDGNAARAIALIVPEEVQVRHSLSHSDLLSRSQVDKLFAMLRKEVQEALGKLSEDRRNDVKGLCVGMSLQSALVGCECKPETVETIFSLLEARENSLLRVQGTFYGRAIVAPRKHSLEELASNEQVLDAILKCCVCVEPPAGQDKDINSKAVGFGGHNLVGQTYGSFCFSISQCANCLGPDAEPRHVFAALRRLQQSGQIEYVLDTTPGGRYIHMRLDSDAVEVLRDDDNPAYHDLIVETHTGFNVAVTTSADKVVEIYRILQQVSKVAQNDMASTEKSESLCLFQKLIREYLAKDGGKRDDSEPVTEEAAGAFSPKPTRKSLDLTVWSVVQYLQQLQRARASQEVESMSLDHRSAADYTALAVTKFLHGIAPASSAPNMCRQHNSFGSLRSVEFNSLRSVVEQVVIL